MITIGIPTLNCPGRLQRALESVADCTSLTTVPGGVRVLVCDDGTIPDLLEKNKQVVAHCAKSIPGLEMLMNNARLGISKTWNRLVRHYGDADIVALLNDDFEVVDFWLDVLVYSLQENPKVGMVGLNSYVSLIKEQVRQLYPRMVVDKEGNAHAPVWHELVPMLDYREAKLLDGGGGLISAQGPAFAFRKKDFDAVGGFDERYFCFYEETDFSCSLRRRGLYPFMVSYPIGYHQGGATNSDPFNLNASEHMARSRQLFIEKWGKTPAELREEFILNYERPVLKEWTSQVHNWK
jgi:GT2 family glycosyltransferase